MPCIECLLGLAPSSIVFVNMYIHTKITIASFTAKGFAAHTGNLNLCGIIPCHHCQCMLLRLVSTLVPLISWSTCSSKLPFFQKAAPVVMIVKCMWGTAGGMFARDKTKNAPSTLLPQSRVQEGGEGHIFGSLWYIYKVGISQVSSLTRSLYFSCVF